MENNNYINYQTMMTNVSTGLIQVSKVCKNLLLDSHVSGLQELQEKLTNHVFSVGIMGEFKRGKSTVINALLGQEIVPADIAPCSATLNYIRWGTTKSGVIHFKDGSSEVVEVDELSNYITKITAESEEMSEKVEDAVVYYPCSFCQNGVQIIDTPGLNDDERMSRISEDVIPSLDAIIMVIAPGAPFSQSEAEFVRNKVLSSDLGRIIFVVNKIDQVDEEDRPRLLKSIKDKIETSVLNKMADIYGIDSEEHAAAKAKIGEIHLLPVSAKMALKGKLKNDFGMVQESGYVEFENTLSVLLTEERGMLELIQPVNQLATKSKEIIETINTRCSALEMHADEFEKIQLESMEQIKTTRSKKKIEIDILKAKGKTLLADMLPRVSAAYDDIEKSLNAVVENFNHNKVDLNDEAKVNEISEKITKSINSALEERINVNCERLANEVYSNLGEDIEKLNSFNVELNNTLASIHGNISSKGSLKPTLSDAGNIIADAGVTLATWVLSSGTGLLPGVGGVIAGFKEHGWKGAATGGISGVAIGMLVFSVLGTVVTGPALALLMGAASTFGGKAVTRLIFGKEYSEDKVIANLKKEASNAVKTVIIDMKNAQTIENWLKETCENAYGKVADDIDNEWENTLASMEATLTQIRIDIEMNAANKEKLLAQFKSYISDIEQVLAIILPIREKLSFALSEEN